MKLTMPKVSGGVLAAISIGLVVLLAVIAFSINNSVTNTGNKKEAVLTSQYLDNQNELSTCITSSSTRISPR
jgi:hypothetical protein